MKSHRVVDFGVSAVNGLVLVVYTKTLRVFCLGCQVILHSVWGGESLPCLVQDCEWERIMGIPGDRERVVEFDTISVCVGDRN